MQPGNHQRHPRTHATHAIAPLLLPSSPATTFLYCVYVCYLLRTPFIHFIKSLNRASSKQSTHSVKREPLLEPAYLDHEQHGHHQRTCAVCSGCILPNFSARSDCIGLGRPRLRMRRWVSAPPSLAIHVGNPQPFFEVALPGDWVIRR